MAEKPETTPWFREWRAVFVIWLLALLIWIPYYRLSRPIALEDPDAQDYAQVARQVYEGHGFQTSIMPLGGLEWMRQTGRLNETWWNLHRFPLPSWIQACLFRLLGPCDLAVSLSSALFFFASIPLVFLFARRLYAYPVALLATALFAFNAGQMGDSITGLTEPATLFLFLAALYLIVWPKGWWSFALAGAITGVAFLNRYSVALYALPMLWWIAKSQPKPLRLIGLFLICAAIPVAPWLVRNYLLAGDPMFSLTSALMARYMTDASPRTHDWYQFVYEKPTHFWTHHPWWTFKKWAMMTGDLWWNNLSNIGALGWAFPFFVIDVLRPYDGVVRRMRNWLIGVFLLHFLTLGLLSNIPRYYIIFTPFLFMFAADAMFWIAEALHPRIKWGQAAFAGFLLLPMALNWMYIAGPPRKPREDRTWVEWRLENQEWLQRNTPPGALIVSDVPWSVAWYGLRRSVPLPPTPEDMARFKDYNLVPDGIYLKAPRKRMNVPDGWNEWRRVQFGGLPLPGYRLAHTFGDHAAYYERLP